VLIRFPGDIDFNLYPDEVVLDGHRFMCDYHYEPGHPEDGVTLKVPLHMISTVPPSSADWIIPGLIREKITAHLKSLPKEYKKKLPPLSHVCDIIVAEMNDSRSPLLSALSNFIHERFHVDIPASVWNPDTIDDHLKIRFAVIDSKGQELASSRDIKQLQKEIITEAESHAFGKARLTWEKTGLTSWDFGELPDAITLKSGVCFEGYAYPGLEAGKGCVNIRLFKSKREADASHSRGVTLLYTFYFKDELKYLKKAITLSGDLKEWAESFGGTRKCEDSILEKVTHDIFSANIRTRDAFIDHAERVTGKILPKGQDILNIFKPVLKSYYDTVIFLKNLEKANRFNKQELQYLAHLREEMTLLIPRDFLLKYNDKRLTHIIRYLKAITIRAERGIAHLEKAFSKTAEIKIFSDKLQDMVNSVAVGDSEEKLKAIEEYRWMIEEFKVSVFAQELKTAFPISQKRLEQRIRELERIV
jgi:ATP-dependent helicase HrpA